MRALLIATAVATVLSLSACKKAEDAAVGVASGGTMAKDGDKLTVKTDEGEATFSSEAGQALPANFPKDVFLPAGATVMSSADMPGAVMVVVEAPGDDADAYAKARAALPGSGWKETAAMASGQQKVLVFENDTHVLQYSFFANEPGKTHLQVNYAAK